MSLPYRIVPAGDSALIVEFEERIDPDVNARTIACAEAIQAASVAGVRDVVPTYRSVAVYFDPLRTDNDALTACLEREAGREQTPWPRVRFGGHSGRAPQNPGPTRRSG